MKIEMMKIGDIVPYEKNPRHNEASIDKVAASIREFGFKQPIVIDQNNVIVCGHTRHLAAKKLKLKEVPCIKADDLSDEKIKAYRLADNKVGEDSEWDLGLLGDELDSIFDIDMEEFGFSLLDDEPQPVVEDDFDVEIPEEPQAKLGDIYVLGDNRLICADSCSIEQINRLTEGGGSGFSRYGPAIQYELSRIRENERQGIKEDHERPYVGVRLREVPV